MSMVNENAAGVDIGAHEIMVCVRGPDHTQLVLVLVTTLQTCFPLQTGLVNIIFAQWRWKAPESIGYPCLKFWSPKISNVF